MKFIIFEIKAKNYSLNANDLDFDFNAIITGNH